MSVDVLAIGDTHLDTVMFLDPAEVELLCDLRDREARLCLDYASKIPVRHLRQMMAGNAANAAVTAARFGARTALWTMLGDDGIGEQELTALAREGIELGWARTTPGTQSHQSTVISVNGERTILVYHAPRQYRLPHDLPPSRWVYLTSLGAGWESIISDLLAYVERVEARLAFQPGTFQLRAGAAALQPLLAKTDLILMNKEEAQVFTAVASDDSAHLIPSLCGLGVTQAVVTDAARGAWAGNADGVWTIGTRPNIPRVEATGAGDAFSAAFVVALANGEPVTEALRWGTANAEAVIQEVGPQAGVLTRRELERQLADHPELQAKEV